MAAISFTLSSNATKYQPIPAVVDLLTYKNDLLGRLFKSFDQVRDLTRLSPPTTACMHNQSINQSHAL
jgi:hypothetical protein